MTTAQSTRGVVARTGSIPQGKSFVQDISPLKIVETDKVMVEHAGAKRPALRVTGIFQEVDKKNQNGRIYPKKIMKEAIENLQEDIEKRAVLGEFDHPEDAKVHLANVSHVITKVWMDGNTVYGVAEVLEDMPSGKMLAALLRNNVQVGISSRGVGEIETFTEGGSECHRVKEGYDIVTWDAVHDPSVTSATLSLMESKNKKNKSMIEQNIAKEINDWLKAK